MKGAPLCASAGGLPPRKVRPVFAFPNPARKNLPHSPGLACRPENCDRKNYIFLQAARMEFDAGGSRFPNPTVLERQVSFTLEHIQSFFILPGRSAYPVSSPFGLFFSSLSFSGSDPSSLEIILSSSRGPGSYPLMPPQTSP